MRKDKITRQVKKEMAEIKRKATRETKKKMFNEALEKGKVETLQDVAGVFFGLSRKAIEHAAHREILNHARHGLSAREIVKLMEGGK